MPKRKRDIKLKGENEAVGKERKAPKSEIQNSAIHPSEDEEPWSKSKKKRMRRLMARMKRDKSQNNQNHKPSKSIEEHQELNSSSSSVTTAQKKEENSKNTTPQLQSMSKKPLSTLQQQFLSRLSGSRFRELNEELYTTNSDSAFKRFQQNPELFEQYHEGFRTQVKSWPVNPIDIIYKWIISFYHKHKKELKQNHQEQLRVADFGCGDAKLAEKLLCFQHKLKNRKKGNLVGRDPDHKNNESSYRSPCPFKVHSFDLVANGNKLITPCDMKSVPLKNGCIDIGVFVLALMGTNIADFIREAHRVLTPNGVLKIAEVRSRFETTIDEDNSEGKDKGKMKKKQNTDILRKHLDDTILNEFLDVMEQLGFKCVQKDRKNKMFIILEFKKTGVRPSKKASFTAKPCIYKRR